mgnify:CR=1 FL=1|jgi:predicted nucleic acid-binding Zn ribbon protein
MSAPKVRKCPECGKLKVRRVIGKGAGVIFKGTGFYETDYKKKDAKQKEKRNEQRDAKKSK